MDNNYDSEYFKWQKEIGEFGGQANLFKFEKYISKHDTVLDFGCGGGYLLKNIQTDGNKIGVEINPTARQEAEKNGVICFDSLDKIEDNSIDVVISNHALEHVEYPSNVLKELKRIIKDQGKILIVVPHENSKTVNVNDKNMHLYTWTPQNLVNLFRQCDINVIRYNSICHMWIPHYKKIQQIVGWNIFHKLCAIYCFIKGTGYQTFVYGSVRK